MRHTYECPMRWADMDLLGHVNNVTYVDYLQEARISMFLAVAGERADDELAEALVVARSDVSYVAPLTYRPEPVLIDCWVTDISASSFTIAYEVYDALPDGDRVVYVRAATKLAPYVFEAERPRRFTEDERARLAPYHEPSGVPPRPPVRRRPAEATDPYQLRVRFSDVDIYRHVNNVKYFEYFQEARIGAITSAFGAMPDGTPRVPMVIAQMDVDYRAPILFRQQPYDVWTWVSRVGQTSFTFEQEVADGDLVFARARVVLVTFDAETQRAAPAPAVYLDALRAALVE
ncbi:acyl-CoA thioesterase [Nocardioides speluncae]|uniref:acyl-CoA thioesterase n=1 Tax=Nocardioides speluncae TaxID=2670337 RepID=UPI000D692342|nr:thioesterase family protein [Nocardioides speluncae]